MIISYRETQPRIDESCFIESDCVIVGDVRVETDSSIWFGAVIREDSIIAAGSVVKEHEIIPSGVPVAGNSASMKRDLADAERQAIKLSAINYFSYVKGYKL